jgi:hypothetical protein
MATPEVRGKFIEDVGVGILFDAMSAQQRAALMEYARKREPFNLSTNALVPEKSPGG